MTFKRTMYASTLAAGVGLTGLFGIGLGTASADPGQCNMPGQPQCGQNQHDDGRHDDNRGPNGGGAPVNWQGRGIDQGRQDHQPFNWNGQQVTPLPAGNGQGWGFWFGPVWIPL
ncbi:hypothetical protein H7K45_20520 [Mycobacterium yunnanensis]|uniref:Chitin-binding protein n=1 Tax=Mycobacterium yunnanensis TaxID=368477 RepID=A0A9X2Z5Q0_9MYCO|nr:hypothetical protein [Mycobacterium yunnanensis]MCV7422940.1 hypothetical protein [Mycobacterium yunnanensis]